jgi:CubicO group peptidase (beta-lactamase class C family)
MIRKRVWIGVGALGLAGLLTAAGALGPAKDISSGTGYSAWDLCTRTMQSGEPYAQVLESFVAPKVRPLPQMWSIEYQAGVRVEVACTLPTLHYPRAAVFRPGLGCTLVPPGVSEQAVRKQAFVPAPEPAADDRAWPLGEGGVESGLLDAATRAVVERHAATIFSESSSELSEHFNATALLVARDGHLLFERYGHGYARERPQLGWSMTKTLTALIAGVLARDGKLSIDQEVGLAQWAGTPKQAIRWRHLLNMAPGLAWFEGYRGASDATQMLFSEADQGAWAADRPMSSTPGSVFTYSTGFTNIAMRRMRELLGGSHQAIYDYYQRELFTPLGIRHGVIEPDASGTPVGGARGLLRPVDWLRLGQLVAGDGTWQGKTILPADYLTFMKAASPASDAYGGSIWREASHNIPEPLRARLPDDVIFFAGHMGQFVIVAPTQRLVVLRMGVSMQGTMHHDPALLQVLELVADLTASSAS